MPLVVCQPVCVLSDITMKVAGLMENFQSLSPIPSISQSTLFFNDFWCTIGRLTSFSVFSVSRLQILALPQRPQLS